MNVCISVFDLIVYTCLYIYMQIYIKLFTSTFFFNKTSSFFVVTFQKPIWVCFYSYEASKISKFIETESKIVIPMSGRGRKGEVLFRRFSLG